MVFIRIYACKQIKRTVMKGSALGGGATIITMVVVISIDVCWPGVGTRTIAWQELNGW